MLLASLLACVRSIKPAFDAASAEALRDPGPPPAAWEPDAVLQVSASLVEDLIEAAVRQQGPLTRTFEAGQLTVKPEIVLKSLAVVPARPCARDCIGLEARFEGQLDFGVGPFHGVAPLTASGALDVVFTLDRQQEELVVIASPERLRELDVSVAGKTAALDALEARARQVIVAEALARVPPLVLARLDAGALPVRAARVSAGAGPDASLQLEVLAAVPTPAPVSAGTEPGSGFSVVVAEPTLLALARAEAFRRGPVGYGVVPEPTALSFGPGTFTLGLRLWRIEGRTWWRDYEVRGTATLREGRLVLAPTDVEERGKSPGAALADPLAALAEGRILKVVEDALATTVPLRARSTLGGARVSIVPDRLEVVDGGLRISGAARIGRP